MVAGDGDRLASIRLVSAMLMLLMPMPLSCRSPIEHSGSQWERGTSASAPIAASASAPVQNQRQRQGTFPGRTAGGSGASGAVAAADGAK